MIPCNYTFSLHLATDLHPSSCRSLGAIICLKLWWSFHCFPKRRIDKIDKIDKNKAYESNSTSFSAFVSHLVYYCTSTPPAEDNIDVLMQLGYNILLHTLNFVEVAGLTLRQQVGVGIFPCLHFVHKHRLEPSFVWKPPTQESNLKNQNNLEFLQDQATWHWYTIETCLISIGHEI